MIQTLLESVNYPKSKLCSPDIAGVGELSVPKSKLCCLNTTRVGELSIQSLNCVAQTLLELQNSLPNSASVGHPSYGLYTHIPHHRFYTHFLSCSLTSTEARWPIRDGDRVGRGRESERFDRGNRPKKTGETVDRRQNNGSVKAVSPRHCPATCALSNCCFNCCAWAESLRQRPLHCC